jgi:hypothetical protein
MRLEVGGEELLVHVVDAVQARAPREGLEGEPRLRCRGFGAEGGEGDLEQALALCKVCT